MMPVDNTKQRRLLLILKDYGILHWEQDGDYGKQETVIQMSLKDLEDVIDDFNGNSTTLTVPSACTPESTVPASVAPRLVAASPVGIDTGGAGEIEGSGGERVTPTPVPEGVSAEIAALEAKLQRFDADLLDQEASYLVQEDLGVSSMANTIWESDAIINGREPLKAALTHK
jgi:hypothetical protein